MSGPLAQPTPEAIEKAHHIQNIRKLFVDVITEDPLYHQFIEFASRYAYHDHYLRYAQTFAGLLSHGSVRFDNNISILETGDYSLISRFLLERGFRVKRTFADLRDRIDAESASFDLVLSLEVIEHIADRSPQGLSDVVSFRGTGARQYANELKRVMRPGATLLLTTPNPCSLKCLLNLLEYRPPMIFRPHVREYTSAEIQALFAELELLEYHTNFSFFLLGNAAAAQLGLFEACGKSGDDRGDDHFFLFRKPASEIS